MEYKRAAFEQSVLRVRVALGKTVSNRPIDSGLIFKWDMLSSGAVVCCKGYVA